VHAECRIGPHGLVLLEIAARPIGGLCSRVLRFTDGSRPVNGGPPLFLEDVLLRHALGEDIDACRREAGGAAVMMIPIPARGFYKGVDGVDDARRIAHVEDVRITAKPDQLLERLPEAGSYLGFIFSRGPSAGDAERAVRAAHDRLRFTIDREIPVVARG
jgi:hypothetical protein